MIGRAAVLALVGALGCDIVETVGLTPDGGGPTEAWTEIGLGSRSDKVDLLFLVDNSPSMAPKQARLRDRFYELIRAFEDFRGQGRPGHYHIGVVTSDLGAGPFAIGGGACRPGGDGGRLQALGAAAPVGCRAPEGGVAFIDYDQIRGSDNLPAGQDLFATFGCMAQVGDRGCGFEHALEAVYRALKEPPPENAGFLRADAVLAVVLLTDEDDCSAPPDTDLFDPAREADFGPLLSYRCTQFGLTCAGQAPPLGASPGALPDCVPAANPGGAGPGKLYDVSRYVDFFRRPAAMGGVKANPADAFVFALAAPPSPVQVVLGNPNPSVPGALEPCTGPFDGRTCAALLQHACASPSEELFGDPAVRIAAVASSTLPRQASICDSSYQPAMQTLASSIFSYMSGNGCVPGPMPDPGDPRCVVEDQLPDGSNVRVPACVQGDMPCWRLEPMASCAPVYNPRTKKIEQLRLAVDRGGAATPDGVITRARCVIVTGA